MLNFRPPPQLDNVCEQSLEVFPQSGEIFAVDLGYHGIFRAVRSDLIFKVAFVIYLSFVYILKLTNIVTLSATTKNNCVFARCW